MNHRQLQDLADKTLTDRGIYKSAEHADRDWETVS